MQMHAMGKLAASMVDPDSGMERVKLTGSKLVKNPSLSVPRYQLQRRVEKG